MKRITLLMVVLAAGLAPAPALGQASMTQADCERAIKETARAYRQGRPPVPAIQDLARLCTTPVRSEPVVSDASDDPGLVAVDPGLVTMAAGSGCRTIQDGRAYYNAFGQEIIWFQGHLHWCFRRGWTTGGHFWMTVRSCCFWFYEGVVDAGQGGCFNGCTFVSRYRRGSFLFNPPWPTITTRMQPWFRLRGNGDGTAVHSSGG
jgi:hypothetical protein